MTNMPPKARKGQGKAPQGFWSEARSKEMLLSVVMALASPEIIDEIDFEKVALVVGEGKVGKKSCR